MIQINFCSKQKETHRLREWTYGYQGGVCDAHVTLLYLKWVTNKDLWYSTENSAQGYVAAWMGGEFEGEWIHVCVCVAESLWCSPETITTLFVNWLYLSMGGGDVLKRAEGFFVEKQASQSENKSFIEGYSVCEACDRSWRGMLKATHQWT